MFHNLQSVFFKKHKIIKRANKKFNPALEALECCFKSRNKSEGKKKNTFDYISQLRPAVHENLLDYDTITLRLVS